VSDELDQARASIEHLRGDVAKLRAERDLLAESLEPYGECAYNCDCGDHAGPRSCGCHVTGEEARTWIRQQETEIDTLSWLHAEAVWQRDQENTYTEQYHDECVRLTTEKLRLESEHQKWADATAETAVRLSDAGYHGQLVDSVTRLIADRDADRESRFRWAEEAARLEANEATWVEQNTRLTDENMRMNAELRARAALRASVVQLPEDAE
jgi:hypothetical protein